MENTTVKLLICYHKPDKLFKDEILTPIHVGRAQAKAANNPNLAWLEENMIGDDTGDNISDKNYCYNELTAPYWAWKNYDALGNPDYVGLMHYRRHFIFDRSKDLGVIEFKGMNDHYAQTIGYSPERVRELVAGQDIVYYRGKVSNIYEHYYENHKIEDLELALQIIEELHPQYGDIARRYVKGDTGCFCNMAIFSREMFFEYCEWLYPILETFFERVDMSEKRFFISERLTGIFIAKKIEEGRRALPLASSFVHTEYRIPVVLPFDPARVFETAVTMQSFIINAKPTTHIDFRILTDGEIDEGVKESYAQLLKARPDFGIDYVDLGAFCRSHSVEEILAKRELYPFVVSELVGGKCFYVTQDVIVMRDIEEFFRLCSVDDFWIVGAGEREKSGALKWIGTSCVINTKRMKDHGVFEKLKHNWQEFQNVNEAIDVLCHEQYSVYSDWFWVNADENALLIPEKEKRIDLQNAAVWHPMICYTEKARPAKNLQAVYSVFWWNVASSVTTPVLFDVDPTGALEALTEDQKVMNSYHDQIKPPPNEPGMIRKIVRYYGQFGFKATVKRFFTKLFRR